MMAAQTYLNLLKASVNPGVNVVAEYLSVSVSFPFATRQTQPFPGRGPPKEIMCYVNEISSCSICQQPATVQYSKVWDHTQLSFLLVVLIKAFERTGSNFDSIRLKACAYV